MRTKRINKIGHTRRERERKERRGGTTKISQRQVLKNILEKEKVMIINNLSQQIQDQVFPLTFAKQRHYLSEDNTLVVIFNDKKGNNFQDLYNILGIEFLKGLGLKDIEFHYTIIYKHKYEDYYPRDILDVTSVHTTCILYATDITGTDYKVSIRYGYDLKTYNDDNTRVWASIEYGHDYTTNNFIHVCPIRKSGKRLPTLNNRGSYKVGYILDTPFKRDNFIRILTDCFPENLSGPPSKEIRLHIYFIINQIIDKLINLYYMNLRS